MACTCSQTPELAASSQLKEQLDDVAENMAMGVEDSSVVQVLSHLSQQQARLEEWRHPSSHLNLLQLAVVHGRTQVTEYLCGQHSSFMMTDLYRDGSPSQPQGACSQGSENQGLAQGPRPLQQQPPSEQSFRPGSGGSTASSTGPGSDPPRPLPSQALRSSVKQEEELLPDKGKLLNHPLHMACGRGDLDSLKALTKLIVHRRSRYCGSGLDAADGRAVTAKLQLQALMKTVSVITSSKSSEEPVKGLPLELAVSSGSVECVKFLLRSILWRWLTSQFYFMCMELKREAVTIHLACCFSAPQLVTLLLPSLPHNALHCKDAQGHTPFHFAVWSGDTDTIRLLLENGADVNAQTSDGSTCLHILFRSKLMPCNLEANTRLLLQYGADHSACKAIDDQNLTPLHVLVEEFFRISDTTLLLLKRKSAESLAVYARSQWEVTSDWTKAEYAESLSHCLRLLLEAGADPSVLDAPQPQGRTVIQHVFRSEWQRQMYCHSDALYSVISSLLEFGATLAEDNDLSDVKQFLQRQPSVTLDPDSQVRFLRLFCQNGVSPTSLLDPLSAGNKLTLPRWNWLGDRVSVGELPSTRTHSSVGEDDLTDRVEAARHGRPVRSLRHSCKVVVWKALGYRERDVDSLHLPQVVKAYLKSDDV